MHWDSSLTTYFIKWFVEFDWVFEQIKHEIQAGPKKTFIKFSYKKIYMFRIKSLTTPPFPTVHLPPVNSTIVQIKKNKKKIKIQHPIKAKTCWIETLWSGAHTTGWRGGKKKGGKPKPKKKKKKNRKKKIRIALQQPTKVQKPLNDKIRVPASTAQHALFMV